jgi:hypothetical protein
MTAGNRHWIYSSIAYSQSHAIGKLRPRIARANVKPEALTPTRAARFGCNMKIMKHEDANWHCSAKKDAAAAQRSIVPNPAQSPQSQQTLL